MFTDFFLHDHTLVGKQKRLNWAYKWEGCSCGYLKNQEGYFYSGSATIHHLDVDKGQTPAGFIQFFYCEFGKQWQLATTVPHATEKPVNKWNFKHSPCQCVVTL